jgi:hypothetical protein
MTLAKVVVSSVSAGVPLEKTFLLTPPTFVRDVRNEKRVTRKEWVIGWRADDFKFESLTV